MVMIPQTRIADVDIRSGCYRRNGNRPGGIWMGRDESPSSVEMDPVVPDDVSSSRILSQVSLSFVRKQCFFSVPGTSAYHLERNTVVCPPRPAGEEDEEGDWE
jgi:hypothetical protein